MDMRFSFAKATGATIGWGLRNVVRRSGANMPGKIALYIDPQFVSHLAPRIGEGLVVVVGTNGKTTVTNLLANIVEGSGKRVACNRTGANLRSGIATTLMQSKGDDWGILECDELWLPKVLAQLPVNYVVLLNLFRDQLDRCGEIDRIQDGIVSALGYSPNATLIYNADDPLCAMVAERAAALEGRESTRSIAFGTGESMGLEQNVVSDATMCQRCSSMFEYTYRQYGQLGAYHCPTCSFARPDLDYIATDIRLDAQSLSFSLDKVENNGGGDGGNSGETSTRIATFKASFPGTYMVYNLMAAAVAADVIGCPAVLTQEVIDSFDPQNGRLQDYSIGGRRVLLNLAKNPTGFNQNLRIVAYDKRPKVVAFFINDKEADGHDISWIWDIDFEELVAQHDCTVFAGGIRKNDLQVRLKYAGIDSQLVDSIDDVIAAVPNLEGPMCDADIYAIANYTALPVVKASLDAAMDATGTATGAGTSSVATSDPSTPKASAADAPEACATNNRQASPTAPASTVSKENPLVIAHLFPDLMNLYGDGGNVRILEQRCRWRGIPVEVQRIRHGDEIDFANVDLVFLGGGPDREQRLASKMLMEMRDDIAGFVEDDGAMLAICGGYQVLGNVWLLGDEEVPGLGIVDIETRRPGTSADRLIDNIVLDSPLSTHPVVGYENHAGRTYLGHGIECFGKVISTTGRGNNEEDKVDGVHYRNLIGTYFHGPLLSKNPEIADYLIRQALRRRLARLDMEEDGSTILQPIDDTAELAANAFMCNRLKVPFDL